MARTKPHIILIHCHDLGAHISPCGIAEVDTPNLQKLAERGVLFENNFCTSPGCTPSRGSIFTGRYPHSIGLLGLAHHNPDKQDFCFSLNREEKHLARFLDEYGYRTALFGVMHETSLPNIEDLGYHHVEFDQSNPGIVVARRAGDYIRRHCDDRKPMFLSIGFFEPHRPFDFGEAQPDDSKGIYIPDYIPQDPEYPEQIDAARKEFAALQGAVREADRAVGIVLDTLDEYGLRDDSIVIFTADHGIAMPMAKCTLYDAGIRTALIVDGPAWNAEGGKRLPGLVSNVDIFPTIADGLELTVADNVHGQSFLAYMQGGSEYRDAVFAEKTYHTIYDPMRCIRTKQYKYIINFESGASYDCPTDIRHNPIYSTSVGIFSRPRPPYELYDLKADPLEQNNLADDKEYTDLSRHLCEGIRSWMQETGDPLLQGPPRSPWYQQVIDSL